MSKKKGESNASRKTWNQAPRQAEKNLRPRQRLFPYKIKTLPLRQRSRGTRPEVRLLRTQTAQAPVPLPVDRPHRRRRQTERPELLEVHQRPEESRGRTGSQDPGRPGGERSWRL